MGRSSALTPVALLLAVSAVSSTSHAQNRTCVPSVGAQLPAAAIDLEAPATDAQLALAAQLAARGRASLAASAYAEAAAALEASFRLSGDASLLGDLGFALQGALRIDEAWLLLTRFKLEAPSAYAAVRARVDAALAALLPRLGGLTVTLSTPTPNARLYYRGWLAGRLPLSAPIFVLPGDVALSVRAPGVPELRVNARVSIGATATVEARLSGALPAVSGPNVSAPDVALEVPATQAQHDLSAQLAVRGRASLAASAWLEAIASLEAAYRLSGDVSLLGDLGFAYQGAARVDLAWLMLHRFKLEAPSAYAAVRARVDAALASLLPRLGGVTIDAGAAVGAQVWYRGMLVARLPLAEPLFVLPGVAPFTVRAAGMLDARVHAEVALGAIARVSASLAPLRAPGVAVGGLGMRAPNVGVGAPNVSVPPVSVAPVVAPAPSLVPLALGITGGVIGVGAIVGYIGFGVLAPRLEAPELMCPAMGGGSQECLNIRGALDVWNVLRITGTVLGTLTIGASIVTYFVLKPALSARPPEAPAPNLNGPSLNAPLLCANGACDRPRRPYMARPVFGCAPTAGGDSAGLGCFGTF